MPHFRHEIKHEITYSDMLSIKSRMDLISGRDKNAKDGTYFIRSLYFDNLYDKALNEKIDGVNMREKFRIRFYNFDTSYIIL
ncbi:MAG: VTC domain-containing protein, partial [Lachnospiraceae bacterium]|nr:VTC domain-containing protein [Lachnospiraceae bacterium]